MSDVIELDCVGLRFGEQDILRAISLRVANNEFVSIVGPSGSGKTSLLKCVNRLVEPTCGFVLIDGRPAHQIKVEILRRSIGYVFQGVGLFPHMSVAENVSITPRLNGANAAATSSIVANLLKLVELPEAFATRMPHELSGGQRQRVGIARALAAKPRIMLMDEPFGALDAVTRESLGHSVRSLHQQLGLTTLMVTHDMMEALLLSDRIVVLEDGAIRFDGTPADVLNSSDDMVSGLVAAPRRSADRISAMLEPGARSGA